MNLPFDQARSILGTAFEPHACRVERTGNLVTLRIHAGDSDETFILTQVDAGRIESIRTLSQLILELRQELAVVLHRHRQLPSRQRSQGR